MLKYNFDDVHVRVSTSTGNKILLSEKENQEKNKILKTSIIQAVFIMLHYFEKQIEMICKL